jgi:F420-dependent oxidoreductase-like protein
VWPASTSPWSAVLELAQHAAASGWDGVYIADHFMPNTADGTPADGPMLECWSQMAALAAVVPRVRLGNLVCGNTYRHPAVLANIAATIDHISGGRVLLGLGAGWQVNEHRAYGIPLPEPRELLDRLEEACQIATGLLRQSRTTVDGAYYRVTDAPCDPKPLQDPLPLLVGGGGERRTMRIAARYADEWNAWSTPDVLAHKVDVLHRHCEGLGRDPASIAVSTQALLFMSDDEAWLRDRRPLAGGGRPTIVGTPAEIVEVMAAYADAGCDEFILPDFNLGPKRRLDTYDRFWAEVASHFR